MGEQGPELIDVGQPSHVYTAQESKGMASSNAEVVALLQRLVEETRSANIAVAKNTGKTARILEQFDGDGMPSTRVV